MIDWADTHRHIAEEITLLCRLHHGEKTDGLLPLANVIEANKSPYNLRAGVTKSYLLHYSGDSVKVALGDSVFSYRGMPEGFAFAPLVIDGFAVILFSREQGNLFLSFTAHDELNRPVLEVRDNEIVYDAGQWDAEWVGQSLTIRESYGKILLKMTFNPPAEIVIEKGRILRNGIEILISRNYFFITNNSFFFGGVSTTNCAVGISAGDPRPDCGVGFSISGIPRYLFDRKKARQNLRACLSIKRNSP
ncbi:hypothetical protein [Pseudomonas poae]|uniref:Cell division protein n=1 Tax=Pseudomonas poae TaxID=200451 RepID=A0AAP2WKI6_9PSED|nr:hypothetical protein [Pseudomonas poae]MCF5656989.1 cell division protein [Pseudomonas poae]